MLWLSYSLHLQICFVKRESKMASLCAILGCLVMLIVPCISALSKRSAPIAYYVFDVFSSASQSDVKASLDGLQLLHSFKVNGTFRIVSYIHRSAAFRHDLCHTIFFSSLKIPILPHNLLRVGVQQKYKYYNNTLLFFDCKSHSCYKDRLQDRCHMHSVHFSFYTRKILFPRCFSQVACIPRKVIKHTNSDFDACETDLDS